MYRLPMSCFQYISIAAHVQACPGLATHHPQGCPFTHGDLYPHLGHGCFGPLESTSQTASRSVQPFLHVVAESPYTLQWAVTFALSKLPTVMRPKKTTRHCLLGSNYSHLCGPAPPEAASTSMDSYSSTPVLVSATFDIHLPAISMYNSDL